MNKYIFTFGTKYRTSKLSAEGDNILEALENVGLGKMTVSNLLLEIKNIEIESDLKPHEARARVFTGQLKEYHESYPTVKEYLEAAYAMADDEPTFVGLKNRVQRLAIEKYGLDNAIAIVKTFRNDIPRKLLEQLFKFQDDAFLPNGNLGLAEAYAIYRWLFRGDHLHSSVEPKSTGSQTDNDGSRTYKLTKDIMSLMEGGGKVLANKGELVKVTPDEESDLLAQTLDKRVSFYVSPDEIEKL